ncbi:MAG: endolytic transglycosylase MltG [Synergistaceae bacterium]|nr:endolytic transglycosylase MltG [Synergistaceae bacterium]
MNKIVGFLLLLCVIASGVAGICMEMYRESVPASAGSVVEVLVFPGQSAREIASEFERAGAVTSAAQLAKWMSRAGIDRKMIPGVYRVTAGRPKDVALELATIKPEVPTITILPGALFEEIAASLGREDGGISLGEALGRDENFPAALRPLLPGGNTDRTVYLAPETYAFDPGDGLADGLVRAASDMWWKLHGEYIPPKATSGDMTSLGILASIVQKEALIDSDRTIIAGVFKNRLKNDMPLQSCATVVYAWRMRGVKITTVSYNDVKIDSPFNTYIHKGLPPENIGTPSAGSWKAALRSADTDMLFFFAKADGSHVFTRTYKEHLAAQKSAAGK